MTWSMLSCCLAVMCSQNLPLPSHGVGPTAILPVLALIVPAPHVEWPTATLTSCCIAPIVALAQLLH